MDPRRTGTDVLTATAAITGAANCSYVNQCQDMDTNTGLNLGGVYKQCSNARMVGNSMNVTEFTGTGSNTNPTQVPKIGSLDWEGDISTLKTFHGARIAKNGRSVNECISASFDPRNLMCLGCEIPHGILNTDGPTTIVFADQNFVPFLSGGAGNCVAIVRGENFSLNDLVDLAAEILDKKPLQPGSILLFGSGFHLFRVGGSCYTVDWIHLLNRAGQRWPNVNICPLIPICRSDCPAGMIRDIEILSSWLGRVYSNSTSGLLDTWRLLLQYTEANLMRPEPAPAQEILKAPLPTSLSISSIQPHTFVFSGTLPAAMKGLDRASTGTLLRTLLQVLSRDFSVNYTADLMLARGWVGTGDTAAENKELNIRVSKNVVLIGASNMRRLVPILQANGFAVTDLSSPGWLATEENVSALIRSMSTLHLEPGFFVVMELFGNSTVRYKQFDGSLSLPFKDSSGYHMGGPITVVEDSVFRRLIAMLSEVLKSAQNSIKIVVPPLPRYLFHKCCGKPGHADNVHQDGHSLELLNCITHFEEILKSDLVEMGVENFWVLDGVGGLLGFPPGEKKVPNEHVITDLRKVFANDGVHYNESSYRNLAKAIVDATIGALNGNRKDREATENLGLGQMVCPRAIFSWRGFTSPVGSRTGCSTPAPGRKVRGNESYGGRGGRSHPYRKN
jgi:hypothetical protein